MYSNILYFNRSIMYSNKSIRKLFFYVMNIQQINEKSFRKFSTQKETFFRKNVILLINLRIPQPSVSEALTLDMNSSHIFGLDP